MHSEILTLSALKPRELSSWRALADAAIVRNPFAEPVFVMSAAVRLHAPDAGLLVVAEGSRWLAAMPIRSVARWRHVPVRCVTGWRNDYCFLGTPLLAADAPEATLACLLRRGADEPGTWAFALEWVDADGPFAEALASALALAVRAPVVVETFERASLDRRSRDDYVERTVSSRHRKELRRSRRLLEAEVGALRVRDLAGDERAPARFLELEGSGWKGRAGTAMAHNADHARLFEDLCRGWGQAGRLQLLALETDERVIAMKCNVRAGAGSFCFKIAFDEQLARFSPGIQLELANIAAFHRGDAAWMDSCADPTNAMINRLWAPRRRLQTLVVSRSGSRGVVGNRVWRSACAWRDVSKRAGRRSHVTHAAH